MVLREQGGTRAILVGRVCTVPMSCLAKRGAASVLQYMPWLSLTITLNFNSETEHEKIKAHKKQMTYARQFSMSTQGPITWRLLAWEPVMIAKRRQLHRGCCHALHVGSDAGKAREYRTPILSVFQSVTAARRIPPMDVRLPRNQHLGTCNLFKASKSNQRGNYRYFIVESD